MKWVAIEDGYPTIPGEYVCIIQVGSFNPKLQKTVRLIQEKDIERKQINVGDWERLVKFIDQPLPPL